MNLITFNDGTEIQEPYVAYDAETKVFHNSQGEEIPAPEAFVMMREFRVRKGKKEAVERFSECDELANLLIEDDIYEGDRSGSKFREFVNKRKKEMLEPLSTPSKDEQN